MAFDMFLEIAGVTGESVAAKHEGHIQLLAWSWGMSQTGTTHHGTGGGAGKVNVQDLSFTHYVDKSSPVLVQACCSGKHFDKATLTMRKAGGSEALEYYQIVMTDLIVTSVSGGSSAGEDLQTENITLNFSAFEIMYQPQDNKGAKKGGPVTAKYDIAKISG
jgi:type VI secretion system secreted protein Hcp